MASIPTEITDLLSTHTTNIDTLTSTLSPLLSTPLHTQTSTLPLLERAKLYILLAYSIESLLFSILQASGIPARSHPIFSELARLKGYYQKVKDAEEKGNGDGEKDGGDKGRARLDKGAAGRFIKHGLAGNERFDRERGERVARERARALELKKKLEEKPAMHKRFDDEEEDVEMDGGDEEGERTNLDTENEELYGATAAATPAKTGITNTDDAGFTPYVSKGEKKKKAREEKSKEEKEARRARKQKKRLERASAEGKPEEAIIPERGDAPKSHSETFNALLDGSFKGKRGEQKEKEKEKERARERKGRKGKGKGN